ncbi:MAG TPA: CheR family methyltransferase [Thermoanaerobaculia bacterium]|nr:CheR family methyltransferase [Thermoanaerobaculia bacterium]
MSVTSSSIPSPIQRFIQLIQEVTGNVVPEARHRFLEEVVEQRAQATGFTHLEDYVYALAAGRLSREWDQVIPLITIKESYFFRAPQQFEAIRTQVLPQLLRARAGGRQLRFWSAACARGEEAGTLAMLLAGELSLSRWDWTILATDVDEEALAGARLGLYGERAVAHVPAPLRDRWFHRRGKLFELDLELRSRIVYQPLNLVRPPFLLPFAELDLVLLRNVLIYFKRPLQRQVVSEITRWLAPSGYLFLGGSETFWQNQEELVPVDLGVCFALRHRGAAPPPAKRAEPAPLSRAAPSAAPPAQRAVPSSAPRDWSEPWSAPSTSELTEPGGIHERLLAAARELAADRVHEAGIKVGEVLGADPSEPAAHALDGFLHDLSGRAEEAVTAYRAALYLDPALYQVRVLLADCLLRLGHRDRAEQQYREVLTTLGSGRERSLLVFQALPFPDRDRAQRRSRQVLQGG